MRPPELFEFRLRSVVEVHGPYPVGHGPLRSNAPRSRDFLHVLVRLLHGRFRWRLVLRGQFVLCGLCDAQGLFKAVHGDQLVKVEAAKESLAVKIREQLHRGLRGRQRHIDSEMGGEEGEFLLRDRLRATHSHSQDRVQFGVIAHQSAVALSARPDPCETQVALVVEAARFVRGVHYLDQDNVPAHPAVHRLQDLPTMLTQSVYLVHNQHWDSLVFCLPFDLAEKGTLCTLPLMAELVLVHPDTSQEFCEHAAQCALARTHQTRDDNSQLRGRFDT
mmetsp:Transcript_46822/g.124339  ORF Transcript_46822/g.124339 Transcript_46822/m.124339 type:complete len:276 (+) Transcript_46822:691-1518(+)